MFCKPSQRATQPAGPDTAVTSQTLLGTVTCSDPAGVVAGRVLTLSAITEDAAADASGTCTWARGYDSNALACADYTVTATGGMPPLQYSIGGASQASNVFTGLGAGTYNIIVTNVDGSCGTANDASRRAAGHFVRPATLFGGEQAQRTADAGPGRDR